VLTSRRIKGALAAERRQSRRRLVSQIFMRMKVGNYCVIDRV
jgi:hypothetical protein